jgi:glycosyltransferase involved in cell wall biosynthesis
MFFSVIVPCFNRVSFLPDLLKKLDLQTFQDFEIVLVDDGSTDGTMEYVQSLSHPKLVYVYQKNAERSAARNNGILHSSGEYLLFLDSDDTLDHEALFYLHQAILTTAKPVAVFGTKNIYSINGQRFSHEQFVLHTGRTSRDILSEFGTVPVSQCAHRTCFENNLFDARFTLWEDTHLWLRILRQFPCYGIDKAQICVNIHEESSVSKGLKNVDVKDVHRYRDAVLDLLSYPDLFPSPEFKPLIKEYIFTKYQMYIYQARINRQYKLAGALLKEALQYGNKNIYFYTTLFKLFLGRFLRIEIK